ncbi:MAG: hypothetical protein HFJ27_05445 [Clostridia bacterium]|nr:hypothetical protein [Clostridia bacterium]
MIKEKVLENKENLLQALSTTKAKYVIGTMLLTGIGIALPRIFHVLAGSDAGATFLPMHIAVLIATLTFGITSSTIVAGGSVIGSYLLTGMPSLVRLPYMLMELVIYAVLLSICSKRFNLYISLALTIVLGRILYAGVLAVAINILGLPTYGISVIESIKIGLPGIILQLAFIPVMAKTIQKGIRLD